MPEIEKYISKLIVLLNRQFHTRLLYVGLQGSYMRGEATERSDIDIMVVIDDLRAEDLAQYRTIIQSMEHAERSCGFICSRTDLLHWNPLEICHVLHTTKDYYGTLSTLTTAFTRTDIQNFVKLSLNNLYHEICHRYIHSTMQKNVAALPYSYKSVFFILQNLHYLRTNQFIATKAELLSQLNGRDYDVMQCSISLNSEADYEFQKCFEMLFTWCQETLHSL